MRIDHSAPESGRRVAATAGVTRAPIGVSAHQDKCHGDCDHALRPSAPGLDSVVPFCRPRISHRFPIRTSFSQITITPNCSASLAFTPGLSPIRTRSVWRVTLLRITAPSSISSAHACFRVMVSSRPVTTIDWPMRGRNRSPVLVHRRFLVMGISTVEPLPRCGPNPRMLTRAR